MRKFKVTALVEFTCTRTLEAENERSAIAYCECISPEEWVTGFTVENKNVNLEDCEKVFYE